MAVGELQASRKVKHVFEAQVAHSHFCYTKLAHGAIKGQRPLP